MTSSTVGGYFGIQKNICLVLQVDFIAVFMNINISCDIYS